MFESVSFNYLHYYSSLPYLGEEDDGGDETQKSSDAAPSLQGIVGLLPASLGFVSEHDKLPIDKDITTIA